MLSANKPLSPKAKSGPPSSFYILTNSSSSLNYTTLQQYKIQSWGNLPNGTMHKPNFTTTRSLIYKSLQQINYT
jgi:hypothetical protein